MPRHLDGNVTRRGISERLTDTSKRLAGISERRTGISEWRADITKRRVDISERRVDISGMCVDSNERSVAVPASSGDSNASLVAIPASLVANAWRHSDPSLQRLAQYPGHRVADDGVTVGRLGQDGPDIEKLAAFGRAGAELEGAHAAARDVHYALSIMNIAKKYGIVAYCGTETSIHAHSLSFESNDIVEVQQHLAASRTASKVVKGVAHPIAFTIIVRGKGGVGDARVV